MLNVENIQVYYGVINAIKGVSFEVNEGEVIALIGANGAGKTTILHTITGLVAPRSGRIMFEGHDLIKTPAHKIISLGMAHVPEGRRIFQQLTVYENLKLGAYTLRSKEKNRTKSFIYLCAFSPFARTKKSGGRHAFRRRTADARYGTRTDVQSEDSADG